MKGRDYQKFLHERQNQVFSYAVYMLRNRQDAEDVTQEAFVKLWRQWDRIESAKRESWMMRVVHNYAVDLLRRKNVRRRPSMSMEELSQVHPLFQADDRLAPDSLLEAQEIQLAVWNALGMLPDRTRSLLLMHYFQDLSCEQIGEVMDMSLSAVKTGLHRARHQLKTAVQKTYPELKKGALHEKAVV